MLDQSPIRNYLTIDVEDYYQVSVFENLVKFEDWSNFESRVVDNTKKILEMLSSLGEIKGTFFILGWVAEKYPGLIKDIDANGHEIACHSYRHRLVYNITPDEFRSDTVKAKNILGGCYREKGYWIQGSQLFDNKEIYLGVRDFGGSRIRVRFEYLSHTSRSIWDRQCATVQIQPA